MTIINAAHGEDFYSPEHQVSTVCKDCLRDDKVSVSQINEVRHA